MVGRLVCIGWSICRHVTFAPRHSLSFVLCELSVVNSLSFVMFVKGRVHFDSFNSVRTYRDKMRRTIEVSAFNCCFQQLFWIFAFGFCSVYGKGTGMISASGSGGGDSGKLCRRFFFFRFLIFPSLHFRSFPSCFFLSIHNHSLSQSTKQAQKPKNGNTDFRLATDFASMFRPAWKGGQQQISERLPYLLSTKCCCYRNEHVEIVEGIVAILVALLLFYDTKRHVVASVAESIVFTASPVSTPSRSFEIQSSISNTMKGRKEGNETVKFNYRWNIERLDLFDFYFSCCTLEPNSNKQTEQKRFTIRVSFLFCWFLVFGCCLDAIETHTRPLKFAPIAPEITRTRSWNGLWSCCRSCSASFCWFCAVSACLEWSTSIIESSVCVCRPTVNRICGRHRSKNRTNRLWTPKTAFACCTLRTDCRRSTRAFRRRTQRTHLPLARPVWSKSKDRPIRKWHSTQIAIHTSPLISRTVIFRVNIRMPGRKRCTIDRYRGWCPAIEPYNPLKVWPACPARTSYLPCQDTKPHRLNVRRKASTFLHGLAPVTASNRFRRLRTFAI